MCDTDHRCKCLVDTDCEDDEKCENGQCVPNVCLVDDDCDGSDAICNDEYDNCFYCGDDTCYDATLGVNAVNCCPGKKDYFYLFWFYSEWF